MSEKTIWDKLKRPPESTLKTITGGRLKGKSDINPQWRLQAMTEVFGAIGIGWKYEIVKLWIEEASNDQKTAFAEINLYIKQGSEWSDGISGIGGSMFVEKEKAGLYTNDECYKMAVTDALSVAMKQLGVASDIYMGLWDGSKYLDKPANNSSSSPTTGNEEENTEPWEITRKKKIGGGGKNKDKTWSELEGKSLTAYVTKEKNPYYKEYYATRAQKEIDWRIGNQKTEDFKDVAKDHDEKSEPTELDQLRKEILQLSDKILLEKWKIKKTAANMTREINNAEDEATLVTLSLRIKTIDTLCITFKAEKIDKENYKITLTKILIANNGELDKIVNGLHKTDPDGDENRSFLEHYCNEIDRQHKELDYNPKQAINSMIKHLGTEDHSAVKDWEPLKEYSLYLAEQIKFPKAKREEVPIEKLEPKTTKIDPHSDTPFPIKDEKESIANPNHEDTMKDVQEEVDIG